MSFDAAVLNRRSVRGFLPKPVPKDLMRTVFDLAQWSPSGTNVQPWQVYVASGSVRDDMRAEFLRRVSQGIPSNPDHKSKGRLTDPFKNTPSRLRPGFI